MGRFKKLIKNQKFLFIVALLLILAVVCFVVSTPAWADTGNHVSHNPSSSSDSDDGGLIWFLLYLVIEYPVIGILLIILFFVFRKPLMRALKNVKNQFDHEVDRELESYGFSNIKGLDQLKENDPNFSEPQFISRVNNMFMQLQDAWMRKDWRSIRPFETDELYNMHARQLQRYIDNNETNVIENICIMDTKIIRYEQDAINDIIIVRIKARFNDYVIDDATKEVKAGDPKRDIYMTYYWKLIRRKGVVTQVNNLTNSVTQCPNCGANVSINAAGECEYCGSVISNGQYDWVLASISS